MSAPHGLSPGWRSWLRTWPALLELTPEWLQQAWRLHASPTHPGGLTLPRKGACSKNGDALKTGTAANIRERLFAFCIEVPAKCLFAMPVPSAS